jgi:two-component system nitrogen regulation response regulator GlnG
MNDAARILLVEDEPGLGVTLQRVLSAEGYQVTLETRGDRGLELARQEAFAVVLTDLKLPGLSGLELTRQLHESQPRLPIIIMTAYGTTETAIEATKFGAFDYVMKPFEMPELIELVAKAVASNRIMIEPVGLGSPGNARDAIIGKSRAMQAIYKEVGRIASRPVNVLIRGETGTGKELIARAIYQHSDRANAPFVTVNCSAIPETLLESELFGHERGAFTGAHTRREGRFEQADGGTLFLDEIGDMPAELQTRLLRVLADGEFYRVGGVAAIKVDVRIIAATHQHLEDLVRQGGFREDLFHRLNVIRIHLPALRDRRADIPLLMRHFLVQAASELGCDPKVLTASSAERLKRLDWPGNVRQLENTARWLTVMASGKEIHPDDLPPELSSYGDDTGGDEHWQVAFRRWARCSLQQGQTALLDAALPAFEQILIETALEHTGGRRQEAARLLGWGRNTLTRKVKDLRLDIEAVDGEDEITTAGTDS